MYGYYIYMALPGCTISITGLWIDWQGLVHVWYPIFRCGVLDNQHSQKPEIHQAICAQQEYHICRHVMHYRMAVKQEACDRRSQTGRRLKGDSRVAGWLQGVIPNGWRLVAGKTGWCHDMEGGGYKSKCECPVLCNAVLGCMLIGYSLKSWSFLWGWLAEL